MNSIWISIPSGKKFFLFSLLLIINLFSQQKHFTLEEIMSGRTFSTKNIMGVKWFDDGNKFTFLKFDTTLKAMAIYEHNCINGEEKIFISGNDLKLKQDDKPFMIQNYEWSPNQNYILFTGMLPARSLKTGGAFYIYDLLNKKFFVLAESDKEQVNSKFSPDGNKIAFVRANNLFVVDIQTGKEKQLTFDGNDEILNGVFDWVYEEEFSIINGIEWSADSKTIGFWRLDQSNVPKLKIAKWDSLHFNFLDMHYPKAGDDNSIVKIGMVNIETGKTVWADLNEETDIYIPRIKFTAEPNILSIQRLDRLQQKLDLLFVDVNTGKSKIVLTERDSCWIDIHDNLNFLSDKKRFIWSSERDNFHHLYLYDYNGKLINQITKGEWELAILISVDEENETIYYTSSERSPLHRDLYSIKFNGKNKMGINTFGKRITNEAGVHNINVSSNSKYFIDRYSNANSIASTYLYEINGNKKSDLAVNDMSLFKDYEISKYEFIKIKTDDGIELNASILKPKNFDASKKYPVLFNIYGGPGSQTVLDQWSRGLWEQLLAQKGFIVFSVDNRGTGFRGKSFRNIVYKKLGQWESNDYIQSAKYLSTLPYIDSKRIGIWGWSYGGYMSALTLMKGSDNFKVGVSVAPVTSWRFYDNIYTERYMSLPKLNEPGYDTTSVLNWTKNYKGKLLLIHGTADDNVHFQNSVKLVEKLVAENKQFQTMFYPEKDHGIYGGKTRLQLYNLFTEFLMREL